VNERDIDQEEEQKISPTCTHAP